MKLFVYLLSTGACNSKLDRHEHIGKGQIGENGFRHLMNDSRFDEIPLILETPEGDYCNEMEKLYGFEEVTEKKE